jgi:hypothetical protein
MLQRLKFLEPSQNRLYLDEAAAAQCAFLLGMLASSPKSSLASNWHLQQQQ